MKKILLTIVAVASLAITSQAALVAHWGFDTYVSGTYGPFFPDDGSQPGATLTVDNQIPANKLNSVPGTIVNDPRLTPIAGQAVQLNGSQALGGFLTIKLSGTDATGFIVTYAAQRSSAGPSVNQWTYSINQGLTFSAVGVSQPGPVQTSWSTLTADFSGITALNGAANVWLRQDFANTGGNGTQDYDNYQVLAQVPEPVNVALAMFGIGIVGLKFGRRIFSFVRK